MQNTSTKTAVAFFLFKRFETATRVFERIRAAKPPKLFVIADGGRDPEEHAQCQHVRSIIDQVDWDCEVLTNYSEVNMGCRQRIVSGLDWVFENVSEAIILEDDCLPNESFFNYCETLLEYYKNDTRIMCISGDNFQDGITRSEHSYYFSAYPHCWGWASWRRAWQHFHKAFDLWQIPQVRQHVLANNCLSETEAYRWEYRMNSVINGEIDTWDYQWVIACWLQGGLTCLPNVNLVTNIGEGEGATHTGQQSSIMNLPSKPIGELVHPEYCLRNKDADLYSLNTHFSNKTEPRQGWLPRIKSLFHSD